uniref:N-alpha-acetyltransferase 15, NatA auxiliary subunit-like n=1 Tax=Styela clava TaxID=7725 RepID=UPI001939FBC3|nr:N-alpha-acetyltransferase 15, NatA auxiliary subunit-like [Styela clava]
MPTKQPLPPKEKTLFNRILKCYEQKQYRNGLKFAKQILSNPKFAEHGETLAMKGLTLNCLNRKEEAYELVKRGLKNDLTSHVCWHVYGLLQRSDKKYDEAIKCYRNALRWEKDNLHILRDLSMLQVHMRDLEGYKETRYNLLQLKSGQRASWIGYAVANHLVKDFDMAFKVLEEFRKTQQGQNGDYEYSELLLYQITILIEAGMQGRALEHLNKHKAQVADKNALMELNAEIFLSLEKYDKAEKLCTELMYRNPENHRYYEMLERAIRPSNNDERLQIYDAAAKIFPKTDSPKIIPLSLVSGDKFRIRVDQFLRSGLERGVPPLFVNLKPLYEDKEKVLIIEELVLNYLIALENCEKFAPSDMIKQAPTSTLWSWYFLAQHYDILENTDKALEYINKAIEHTPTLIEAHTLKAKILLHAGDMPSSVKCMDEAQSLDTADRFVNYKCACYMIRNNQIEEAENMASKFTRETISVQEYLREMQCMWFEAECANAHFRGKKYGEALKKCHEIDRHFREILEDQFDFHQYCMRKMTLRSYVQMLRLEDQLRLHKFYFDAALVAIKVYLRLHDKPQQLNGDQSQLEENSMSKSELKKLRNKQRKQKRKQAEEERKKQEQEKANKNRQQRNKVDEDNEGIKKDEFDADKLVSVENPIQEARSFLTSLLLHHASKLDTHVLAFEIYEREKKFLLMIRALLKAKKLVDGGARHPSVHLRLMKFVKAVSNASSEINDAVKTVIDSMLDEFLSTSDYETYNMEYIEENKTSISHLFAGCQSMYILDPSKNLEAAKRFISSWKEYLPSVDLQTCTDILESFREGDFGALPKDLIQEFQLNCSEKYSHATAFKTATLATPESDTKPVAENGTNSDNHVNEQTDIAVSCN